MADVSTNQSERSTARMCPVQLHELLAPERTTANLVILLDRPKVRKDYFRSAVALYCFLAIALFVLGFIVSR